MNADLYAFLCFFHMNESKPIHANEYKVLIVSYFFSIFIDVNYSQTKGLTWFDKIGKIGLNVVNYINLGNLSTKTRLSKRISQGGRTQEESALKLLSRIISPTLEFLLKNEQRFRFPNTFRSRQLLQIFLVLSSSLSF